jgi:hypothetical protein
MSGLLSPASAPIPPQAMFAGTRSDTMRRALPPWWKTDIAAIREIIIGNPSEGRPHLTRPRVDHPHPQG